MLYSLAVVIFVHWAHEVERLEALLLEGGGDCERRHLKLARYRLEIASERLVKECLAHDWL
jgi:hypothetical protein